MSPRHRRPLLPLALLLATAVPGSSVPQESKPAGQQGAGLLPEDERNPAYDPETFRDERAEKVLRTAIDAQGGEDAIRGRKTIYYKRKITKYDTPDPVVGTLTVWFKRPLKLRQEVAYAQQKQVRVFDGERAWVDEGDGPKLLGPLVGRMMERGIREIDAPLLYLEGSLRYQNISKDLQGRLAQRLSWRNEGYARDLMIDVATGHLIVVGEYDTPVGAISRMKVFDDFRPVGKLILPFRQVVLRNDQKYSETETIEIRFDNPIDDSLFEFPGSDDAE